MFKIIQLFQLFVLKLFNFISFSHTAIRNDNVSGMPILIRRINISSLSLLLSFSTVDLRIAFFFPPQANPNWHFWRNHSKTTVWNEDLWCQKITSALQCVVLSKIRARQMSRYSQQVLAFHLPSKRKKNKKTLANWTMGSDNGTIHGSFSTNANHI